jgi:hypothetical protein
LACLSQDLAGSTPAWQLEEFRRICAVALADHWEFAEALLQDVIDQESFEASVKAGEANADAPMEAKATWERFSDAQIAENALDYYDAITTDVSPLLDRIAEAANHELPPQRDPDLTGIAAALVFQLHPFVKLDGLPLRDGRDAIKRYPEVVMPELLEPTRPVTKGALFEARQPGTVIATYRVVGGTVSVPIVRTEDGAWSIRYGDKVGAITNKRVLAEIGGAPEAASVLDAFLTAMREGRYEDAYDLLDARSQRYYRLVLTVASGARPLDDFPPVTRRLAVALRSDLNNQQSRRVPLSGRTAFLMLHCSDGVFNNGWGQARVFITVSAGRSRMRASILGISDTPPLITMRKRHGQWRVELQRMFAAMEVPLTREERHQLKLDDVF